MEQTLALDIIKKTNTSLDATYKDLDINYINQWSKNYIIYYSLILLLYF